MSLFTKQLFGYINETTAVEKYTISNDAITLSVLNLGATIQELTVKDRTQNPVDIVAGYDNVADYQAQTAYVGAVCGRCANRIQHAAFLLNGERYRLNRNEGANQLHGGIFGFDKKLWKIEPISDGLRASLFSINGEEGYPGNMLVQVDYLIIGNSLIIEYRALSDQDTVCNLTNHTYFNLSGHNTPDLQGHTLKMYSSHYTPLGEGAIPTGVIKRVQNSPFDFRKEKPILQDINADDEQIINAKGYDHNYIVDDYDGTIKPFAVAKSNQTGICMKLFTTTPGVQFYTANYLSTDIKGKNGAVYKPQSAFCLETQYFPNAINTKNFMNPIAIENVWWKERAIFEFTTEK